MLWITHEQRQPLLDFRTTTMSRFLLYLIALESHFHRTASHSVRTSFIDDPLALHKTQLQRISRIARVIYPPQLQPPHPSKHKSNQLTTLCSERITTFINKLQIFALLL